MGVVGVFGGVGVDVEDEVGVLWRGVEGVELYATIFKDGSSVCGVVEEACIVEEGNGVLCNAWGIIIAFAEG